jgi:hypothetical protein
LPSTMSCNFSTSTLTPAGSPASATLTIVASPSVAALRGWSVTGGGLALAVCVIGFGRRRRLQYVLALVLAFTFLGIAIGCGYSPNSKMGPYGINVVAISGSMQRSTPVTVNLP